MSLYQQLEQQVSAGFLSWQEILSEIHRIKRSAHLSGVSFQVPHDDMEQDYQMIKSDSPSQIDIIIRKELWERLSTNAKKVAHIMIDCGMIKISKVKRYKELRQAGLKRREIIKAEKELAMFSKELTQLDSNRW